MPQPKEDENDISALDRLKPADLFGVQGKTVLVTGGGSGIGAMITIGFVAGGANVIICSRKDSSGFASALTERGPGTCEWIAGDLSSDDGVQSFVESFKQRQHVLNVLINNSGTNWSEPIESYSMKGWDKVYALNVKAVFHLTRLLLPLLEAGVKSTGSHSAVINISSIDALQVPILETYAYSSGKAAVTHMSKVLAGQLASRNITVNAVCPGPFMSRMMRATIEALTVRGVADTTALGRIGKDEDMAGVCLYLAAKAGAFVTGASIVVDGGSLVRVRSAL